MYASSLSLSPVHSLLSSAAAPLSLLRLNFGQKTPMDMFLTYTFHPSSCSQLLPLIRDNWWNWLTGTIYSTDTSGIPSRHGQPTVRKRGIDAEAQQQATCIFTTSTRDVHVSSRVARVFRVFSRVSSLLARFESSRACFRRERETGRTDVQCSAAVWSNSRLVHVSPITSRVDGQPLPFSPLFFSFLFLFFSFSFMFSFA